MFYEQINKAGYPAMLKTLAAKGVDTRAVQASIQMMLQQQSQPQQHQEDAAPADSSMPEGFADSGLVGMLGGLPNDEEE